MEQNDRVVADFGFGSPEFGRRRWDAWEAGGNYCHS